jgi:hypothetical protein
LHAVRAENPSPSLSSTFPEACECLWGARSHAQVADQRCSSVGHDPGVSLRLPYLMFRQVLGLVLLPGRTSATKDIELLVLRHKVAVLRRSNPCRVPERAVVPLVFRSFPGAALVRGPRGHAGDEGFTDLGG